MTINDNIQTIIAKRQSLLPAIQREEQWWDDVGQRLDRLKVAAQAAGNARNATPEMKDLVRQVESIMGKPAEAKAAMIRIRNRCARNTINIGVGGAARMGKSTLLQSITGLGEQQIPTSDTFFCTAIRSQIINSPGDGYAIADFHDERSLFQEVILPAYRAAKIEPEPNSLDSFVSKPIIANCTSPSAEQMAILTRLKDAREAIPAFRSELTGSKGRRISLVDLKPFVAYPDDGKTAGPFLAVRELTIYAPFPSTGVKNIQVMDLPGLGEAGIDLAAIQTRGMEDACDLTVLIKRPTQTNVAWTGTDTTALGAMGRALGDIGDQTKFTVILANVGGSDVERTEKCLANIKHQMQRSFEVWACDAIDRNRVSSETMPQLLNHLAKHLPDMDADIHRAALESIRRIKTQMTQAVAELAAYIRRNAPQTGNTALEVTKRAQLLRTALANDLFAMTEDWRRKADDKDWNEAIDGVHAKVRAWIDQGCGYGSVAALKEAVANNILLANGQPNDVVNAVRVGLTDSWEQIDLHLGARIAGALRRILTLLQKHTGTFVPASDAQDLDGVRKQLLQVADRFDSTASMAEDRISCPGIAGCLRRLAGLDISYRFHLMPLLHSATITMAAGELPKVNNPNAAAAFTDALMKRATEGAGKIAKALHESDDKGFVPNRIILAVADVFFDALIRAKDAQDEFTAWSMSWRDEIWPTVFTTQEADSAVVKRVRAAIQDVAGVLDGPVGI